MLSLGKKKQDSTKKKETRECSQLPVENFGINIRVLSGYEVLNIALFIIYFAHNFLINNIGTFPDNLSQLLFVNKRFHMKNIRSLIITFLATALLERFTYQIIHPLKVSNFFKVTSMPQVGLELIALR